MSQFRLSYGGTYTVSGVPVVVSDLASTLTSSIVLLLVAALVVMAVTLLIVFRGRLPAAAAAGDRAGGLRNHVRADRAARRHADDGLDRGAADPDRPGRRLRDPVPVPGRGGARCPIGNAAAGSDGRSRPPPPPPLRRSRPPRWRPPLASWCSSSRPCRWSAASGCCWSSGSRSRWRCAFTAGAAAIVLADRGVRLPSVRVPAALAASLQGARDILADAGVRLRPRRSRTPAATAVARPPAGRRRAGAARRRRQEPRQAARDRRVAGGAGLGRGHPDLGPVGRDQARPLEHAGAPRPAHARARHWRLR